MVPDSELRFDESFGEAVQEFFTCWFWAYEWTCGPAIFCQIVSYFTDFDPRED